MKNVKGMLLLWIVLIMTGSFVSAKAPATFEVRPAVITDKDRAIRVYTQAHLGKKKSSLTVKANGKVICKSSYKDYNPKNGSILIQIPKQKGGTVLDFYFQKSGMHVKKEVLAVGSLAPEKRSKKLKKPLIQVLESYPPQLAIVPAHNGKLFIRNAKGEILSEAEAKKGVQITYSSESKDFPLFVYTVKKGKRSSIIKVD